MFLSRDDFADEDEDITFSSTTAHQSGLPAPVAQPHPQASSPSPALAAPPAGAPKAGNNMSSPRHSSYYAQQNMVNMNNANNNNNNNNNNSVPNKQATRPPMGG